MDIGEHVDLEGVAINLLQLADLARRAHGIPIYVELPAWYSSDYTQAARLARDLSKRGMFPTLPTAVVEAGYAAIESGQVLFIPEGGLPALITNRVSQDN